MDVKRQSAIGERISPGCRKDQIAVLDGSDCGERYEYVPYEFHFGEFPKIVSGMLARHESDGSNFRNVAMTGSQVLWALGRVVQTQSRTRSVVMLMIVTGEKGLQFSL